jgi:hypothetical protein
MLRCMTRCKTRCKTRHVGYLTVIRRLFDGYSTIFWQLCARWKTQYISQYISEKQYITKYSKRTRRSISFLDNKFETTWVRNSGIISGECDICDDSRTSDRLWCVFCIRCGLVISLIWRASASNCEAAAHMADSFVWPCAIFVWPCALFVWPSALCIWPIALFVTRKGGGAIELLLPTT